MVNCCVNCGSRIILSDRYCRQCGKKIIPDISFVDIPLSEYRKMIIQEVIKELNPEKKQFDEKFALKLEKINDLVKENVISKTEFNLIKDTLIKNQQYKPQGRFSKMWETTQKETKKQLVKPESAKFPELKIEFIDFKDCKENEVNISAYVETKSRSSDMLKIKIVAKFNLDDSSLIKIEVNQPNW